MVCFSYCLCSCVLLCWRLLDVWHTDIMVLLLNAMALLIDPAPATLSCQGCYCCRLHMLLVCLQIAADAAAVMQSLLLLLLIVTAASMLSTANSSESCPLHCKCRESVAINASLMTLGRCLEALRWNQQHRAAEPKLVPYRESKVTSHLG